MPKAVVGISGASGIIYGLRLIDYLSKSKNYEVYTILSKNALKVAVSECCSAKAFMNIVKARSAKVFLSDKLTSSLSSSSSIHDFNFMVIAPCSLKTLASIANSLQSNLLVRTALNFLRLGKPLVLVVRETPITVIDVINMLKVAIAGGTILPASPAFYGNPKDIAELVDHVVGKILDYLGVENDVYERWRGVSPTRERYLCVQFFGQECL